MDNKLKHVKVVCPAEKNTFSSWHRASVNGNAITGISAKLQPQKESFLLSVDIGIGFPKKENSHVEREQFMNIYTNTARTMHGGIFDFSPWKIKICNQDVSIRVSRCDGSGRISCNIALIGEHDGQDCFPPVNA